MRLRTIPTVWKEMIENLRQHLQVHIDDIEREYQSMLESNQRILDQISRVEEEYSKSESSQQTKAPLVLGGDDLSKWAQMMKDYVASRKRKDQKNVGIKEAVQEETSDTEESKEPIKAAILLRDAPTESVEDKHKSQKKGLFSFGPAHPAKEDSKEERAKSTEKARQDGSEDKDVAVCQKVKTILQAFSADHDIFWFRYMAFLYPVSKSIPRCNQVDMKYSSDIPELCDTVIPDPMKLIKAMRTIIRHVPDNM